MIEPLSEPDGAWTLALVCPPGLEPFAAQEARALGFKVGQASGGVVEVKGDRASALRANLGLRGASRVLVRLASFPVSHISQLDKSARKLPWGDWFLPGTPIRVEAVCRKSKVYHSGAAAQRVQDALVAGARCVIPADPHCDAVLVQVRIVQNLCTISLDTSGELLHRRGYKADSVTAPMRETMASLFLRACGYDGTNRVFDPMCGSGTLVLEAAGVSAGFVPGSKRCFAMETFAGHDPAVREAEITALSRALRGDDGGLTVVHFGADKNAKALSAARANARRAGLEAVTRFDQRPLSQAIDPDPNAGPGLIVTNPPYGERLGKGTDLKPLYAAFGRTVRERFADWKVAMIATNPELIKATGLAFAPPGPPAPHGGLKVRLWQTGPASALTR